MFAEKALKPIHRNRFADLIWIAVRLAPPKKPTLVTKERERCPNDSTRPRILFGAGGHIHCCKACGTSIEWALGESRECCDSAAGERNVAQNAGLRITAPLEMRPKLFGDEISIRHRYSQIFTTLRAVFATISARRLLLASSSSIHGTLHQGSREKRGPAPAEHGCVKY